jgi:HEAT repeat protein
VPFDWVGFQRELVASLVQAVRSAAAERPGERFYAATLDGIYRETDGVITLPNLGLNSEEALAHLPAEQRSDLRWSPADWDGYDVNWLPDDRGRSWEHALAAEACRGTQQQWNSTFNKYLTTLVRVCKQARTALRTTGVTDKHFLVLLLDDEHHVSLLRRCLTRSELSRHFPEFDEYAVERARVAELPDDERCAIYVANLGSFVGPIDAEEAEKALRAMGPAAFPALIPLLGIKGQAWTAAKLLADIGQPDDGVVDALDAALVRLDQSDQLWVARALSRLGRLDLVLDKADRLPEETVVAAVAAPFSRFRDHAVSPLRLNYRSLEDFIERRPAYVHALAEELKPGRGHCHITIGEVDEVVRGLASSHVLVRRHATCVLGERSLGPAVARRVLPLLGRVVGHDPDPSVRRLAILSLLWWQKDARRYADVIRDALNDPDPDVRETAAYWLREHDTSQPK